MLGFEKCDLCWWRRMWHQNDLLHESLWLSVLYVLAWGCKSLESEPEGVPAFPSPGPLQSSCSAGSTAQVMVTGYVGQCGGESWQKCLKEEEISTVPCCCSNCALSLKPNEVPFEKCPSHSGWVLFCSCQHEKPRSASAAINLGHLLTRTLNNPGLPLAAHPGPTALPQLPVHTLASRGVGTVALLGTGWQWHWGAKLLSSPSALSKHSWNYGESRECRALHQAAQT